MKLLRVRFRYTTDLGRVDTCCGFRRVKSKAANIEVDQRQYSAVGEWGHRCLEDCEGNSCGQVHHPKDFPFLWVPRKLNAIWKSEGQLLLWKFGSVGACCNAVDLMPCVGFKAPRPLPRAQVLIQGYPGLRQWI